MTKFLFLFATPTLFGAHLTSPTLKQPEPEKKVLTNSIGMKLVLIKGGSFIMGGDPAREDVDTDERQFKATISKDFYIGVFEVTQSQYAKVMGTNPSQFQGKRVNGSTSSFPVEQVSWNDAVRFCKKLSERSEERAAGRTYRLPTEAEWECACRAGTETSFSFGDDPGRLGEYAWFASNGQERTHEVGKKKPNAWGLHDMHGNAWEWCADWFDYYPRASTVDPTGPPTGSDRVYRGGSWNYGPHYSRSANRTATAGDFRGFPFLSISFRVAMDVPKMR